MTGGHLGPRPATVREEALRRRARLAPCRVVLLLAAICWLSPARAEETAAGPDEGPVAHQLDPAEAERLATEALAADENPSASPPADAPDRPAPAKKLNALDLYLQGGILMIPITLMSLVVVAFSLERALGLRRGKILPRRFVRDLGELARAPGGFDPRAAYKLCQQNRSAAAQVVRAALLKIGRPLGEIEHAVTEASEREAAKLYANVRPINLAVTITPLLGLLGTVQGMIQAFFITAESPVGVNKAQNLAAGIYVALVTTFAGLSVAIPAAMIAHYFEGRIQRLFHDIDDLVQSLLPQMERFEGKLKAGRGELSYLVDAPPGQRAAAEPAARPTIEPPPLRTAGESPRRPATTREA